MASKSSRKPSTSLDWVNVHEESLQKAVSQGLAEFASELHRDHLHGNLTLLTHESDPWTRSSSKREIDYEISDDPVEAWVTLVTAPSNFHQYQAFMLSSWEHARALASSADAFRIANHYRSITMDRAMSDWEVARGQLGDPLEPF